MTEGMDGGDGQCGTNNSGGGGGGGGGGSSAGGSGGSGAGGGLLLKSTGASVINSGTIDTTGGNSSTVNGGTVKIFGTCGADTTGITSGRTYVANNCTPSAPSLFYPISDSNGNSVFTTFKVASSDEEQDYLRYWIDICSDSTCTTVIRSVCLTSSGLNLPAGSCTPSQTGWTGQDTQGGTAYTSNSILARSQLASYYYQSPYLDKNTQYWWRAYAIDPGGSNTWSTASPIATFVTAPRETRIQGSVNIKGNVKIGP